MNSCWNTCEWLCVCEREDRLTDTEAERLKFHPWWDSNILTFSTTTATNLSKFHHLIYAGLLSSILLFPTMDRKGPQLSKIPCGWLFSPLRISTQRSWPQRGLQKYFPHNLATWPHWFSSSTLQSFISIFNVCNYFFTQLWLSAPLRMVFYEIKDCLLCFRLYP